jgi:hypothetical protein
MIPAKRPTAFHANHQFGQTFFWGAALLLIFTAPILADAGPAPPWVGVHVGINNARDVEKLRLQIPALAKLGVNTLVLEIDYSFQFKSHPELSRPDHITHAQARALADLCRQNHIRPIPQLNCLGHQSWARHTAALLASHPELDETPGKYPDNQGIYCRSWCPLNPKTNQIVFALIDEMIDAFNADAFHVGMDEVFIIGSDDCPLCKGHDHAELFAAQVNALHEHLVHDRHLEMFMWADRLLDARALGYSKWEASANGTAAAIDKIPPDIVLCDWHYERQPEYKSLDVLLDKGFRVWPCGWHDVEAARAFMDAAIGKKNPRMVGYLSTTWGKVSLDHLADFPPTKLACEKFGETGKQSSGAAP